MTASRGIALPDSTTPQINGFGEVNKGKAFCFVFITFENLEIIDVFSLLNAYYGVFEMFKSIAS